MAGRIVGLIACLLCAVPFLIIGVYDRESSTPISFWSGDKSLMEKVQKEGIHHQKIQQS